ncbi:uncharacterized protein LOC106052006 [Biomphalaria glabrata]|uniref:Uncharacterized protein LOC106052006 n=1 Tax=Biomphalaria glabrata TaxID=6526 RepID=A0A9U8DWA8_BIOGL|nr:uncharacterized protein LOC106052006 [Biomphalaria glabrata]
MDMGHLYHDSYFSSMAIELAVKERLKTREVNAREDRALQQTSQSFNRASLICQKNQSYEKWRVGQSLRKIRERSPGLDSSLALEKARVEALQRALLSRSYVKDSSSFGVPESASWVTNRSVASMKSSADSVKHKEEERLQNQIEKVTREKPLNTKLGRDLLKQADFVRRSEHTVKALARLRWRQDKRRLDHRRCKEELMAFSKPLIEKASVVLKGRDDLDVTQFLEDFEHFIIGKDHRDSHAEAKYSNSFMHIPSASASDGPHELTPEVLQQGAEHSDVGVSTGHLVATTEQLYANTSKEKVSHSENVKGTTHNKVSLNSYSHNARHLETINAHSETINAPIFPLPAITAHSVDERYPDSVGSVVVATTPGNVTSHNASVAKDAVSTESDTHNAATVRGGPLSLSSRGAVWLPQLWRQHKKRILSTYSLPKLKHRRKVRL